MNKSALLGGVFIIFLMFFSSVFGQSKINFQGPGIVVGYVDPEGEIKPTISYGVRLNLGTIFHKNVRLMTEFLYWSSEESITGLGQTLKLSYSQYYVTAFGKYVFGIPGAEFGPYAGGGLGMVGAKVESDDPNVGDTSTSETDICLHFIVGYNYLLLPRLSSFGELRFTLDGNNIWGIFTGFTFYLKR